MKKYDTVIRLIINELIKYDYSQVRSFKSMIKFRFISLNSEGFLIQQKGPMVRFINYFSILSIILL